MPSGQNSGILSLFQSTPPHGEQPKISALINVFTRFQSAITHEERYGIIYPSLPNSGFNPRPHKRSDSSTIGHTIPRHCFNPHPTRGAISHNPNYDKPNQFQSTLPYKERWVGLVLRTNIGCFNPRSTRGAKPSSILFISLIPFQSSLLRGKRAVWCGCDLQTLCFNPHSQPRSDALTGRTATN